jgi:hypothetical protein
VRPEMVGDRGIMSCGSRIMQAGGCAAERNAVDAGRCGVAVDIW